jgi:uncharacterized protein YeaO (DUF488 family)
MNTLFEKSEGIAAYAKAWPKAQADMGAVLKDKTNPAFRSKYADLGAVIDAVLPALNKHGFGLMQAAGYDPETKCAVCRTEIMHESGEWKAATLFCPVTKPDAQGLGSALTYARRYSLQAATGVAPEDDDGNAAVAPQRAQPARHEPEDGVESLVIPAGVPKSSAQAKRDGDWTRMTGEIAAARTSQELRQWAAENADALAALPHKWKTEVRAEYEAKLVDLKAEEQAMRESASYGVPMEAH